MHRTRRADLGSKGVLRRGELMFESRIERVRVSREDVLCLLRFAGDESLEQRNAKASTEISSSPW
jgi:hypothetical protein